MNNNSIASSSSTIDVNVCKSNCSYIHSNTSALKALWTLLIWSIILSPVCGPIVDQRDFSAGFGGNLADENSLSLSASLFRAFGTYWLVFVFILILVHGFRTGVITFKKPKYIVCLWCCTLVLATLPIISTVTLKASLLKFGDLIMLLIFTASYLLKPVEISWWAKKVRTAILIVYIYGSLFAAIIAPDWAINKGYNPDLSLFNFRLYGISAHPNSLAPLAIIFIILGWLPAVKLRWEFLHVTVALIVLLLSQAKTTWVCFLLILIIKYFRNLSANQSIRLKYTFISFCCLFVISFSSLIFSNKIYSFITDKLSDPEVITLTGRLPIWFITVEAWLQRPLLGIGLTLWDNDMRMEFSRINREWTPNTAHSQFFQALGSTGIIGLAFLLIYFYLLFKISTRLRSTTDWLSIYLIVFAITRSFTEVWIRLQGDTNFILSWIVFVFIILSYQQISNSNNVVHINLN